MRRVVCRGAAANTACTVALIGTVTVAVLSSWSLVPRSCVVRLGGLDSAACGAGETTVSRGCGRGTTFEELLEAEGAAPGTPGRMERVPPREGDDECVQRWKSSRDTPARLAAAACWMRMAVLVCEAVWFLYDTPAAARDRSKSPAARATATFTIVMQRLPAPLSLLVVSGALRGCRCLLIHTVDPRLVGRGDDAGLGGGWRFLPSGARTAALDVAGAVADAALASAVPGFVAAHSERVGPSASCLAMFAAAWSCYRLAGVVLAAALVTNKEGVR